MRCMEVSTLFLNIILNEYAVPEKYRDSNDRPTAGGPLHTNHCAVMVRQFRYTHEIFRLRAMTRFARIHPSVFADERLAENVLIAFT